MKNKLNLLLSKLIGYKLIRKDFDIHLQLILDEKYGHKLSRETGNAVDSQGKPVPWITYAAFEYLDQLDLTDKRIFEYGCGNSTRYFSEKCHSIFSVESNKDWYESVKSTVPNNAKVILKSQETFAKAITESDQKYDIIFIDSSTSRVECAQEAIHYLKEDGLIILDNSDRFENAATFLGNQDYIQVDMHGFGPIAKYTFTTSFFFTRKSNFKSTNSKQPSFSKGAISRTSQ